MDPVDDERSSQEENNDVKEFRVGARHVEAKIAGEWTEIKHCYAWDNVVCENFDVNGNGEAVHPTRRTVVFSCEL